jgi:hypothetical protein
MALTKEERQRIARSIPRCSVAGCNQGRAMDSDMCGTHRRDHEAYLETCSDRQSLVERIYEAETIDDMKSILVDIVEKLG